MKPLPITIVVLAACMAACSGSESTCASFETSCGGACVATDTDEAHCGTCGEACGADEACIEGVCQLAGCPDGGTVCAGVCVDTDSDTANCGGCGDACLAGEACIDGGCEGGETCTGDERICGGGCVDLAVDIDNCGECGNECGDGAWCVGGTCTCSEGLEHCAGQCVDLDTDDEHCGECLDACLDAQACIDGECAVVVPETCNGVDDDLDGLTDADPATGEPLVDQCSNPCGDGVRTCRSGEWSDCSAPTPTDESCDASDNDCDGIIDNGVSITLFDDSERDGFGNPNLAFSLEACGPVGGQTPTGGVWVDNNLDCDDRDATINPDADEVCDDRDADEDCDGVIDEGCDCDEARQCGTDVGVCEFGVQPCEDGVLGECGGDSYVAPMDAETCNGEDDDCDGEVDEGLAADRYEFNDLCTRAAAVPTADHGGPAVVVSATLYDGTGASDDRDWYLVRADEGTSACVPYGLPGLTPPNQCGYEFELVLTPPTGSTPTDWRVCIYEGTCDAFVGANCSGASDWDADAEAYRLRMSWDGYCGLEDSREFYVAVEGATGFGTCEPYELSLGMSFGERACL